MKEELLLVRPENRHTMDRAKKTRTYSILPIGVKVVAQLCPT